jgi:hypothetical protein
MNRRKLLTLLPTATICGTPAALASASCNEDNDLLVSKILGRMQTIKPGMTRTQFLSVFREEGGFHGLPLRTYRSRDCGYFAVDVSFRSSGAHGRGEAESPMGNPQDLILTISLPYLKLYEVD